VQFLLMLLKKAVVFPVRNVWRRGLFVPFLDIIQGSPVSEALGIEFLVLGKGHG
jgi:hypothetical protein